jgi:hypothetical protein
MEDAILFAAGTASENLPVSGTSVMGAAPPRPPDAVGCSAISVLKKLIFSEQEFIFYCLTRHIKAAKATNIQKKVKRNQVSI